jgi:PAS domain S-box-containing protein
MDWEAVFRAIGSPALILAPDHSILAANDATCTLTGKTEKELRGRKCWEVFHGTDATHPPECCPMERALTSQNPETSEMEVSLNCGFYLVSCTPIFDSQGVIRSLIHIATDITEKKNAERMMQENRDQFRLLFEQSPVPYQSLDADGRFLVVNDAWLSTLGYDRDEVIGHWFGDFITPAFSGRFRVNFPKFMAAGETHVEFGMKRKDGSVITVAFDGRIGHYPDGSFRQTHCMFRDITREKAAEEAIRESEEKYRLIADNTADNIWIFDMDFQLKYVSPSVKNMKGFSVDEIMEMPLDQQMTPESLATVVKRFNEEMELEATGTADPYRKVLFETEEYCKDGSTILVENSVTLLRDASGNPYGILGISRDISDRRKVENALRESEAKYRLLADTSPEMIFLIDTEGYVRYVNPVAARQFQAPPEELEGKHLTGIYPPETAQYHLDAIRKVIADGRMITHETIEEFPTGKVYLDVRLAPVINSRNEVTGVLGLSHDITERKCAEEQRELLLHELAQKNGELDRFTYTVSHDLKSPLLSIRGFLSLLEDDLKSGSDERVQTDILRISESAEKLECLITTLLALSRSGKSVDTPVRIPFVDLSKEAARLLGSTLQQRGVTPIISESMPFVNGDRQRLLQVMTNLLDNAVKFMGNQKDPRIEIGVRDDDGTPVFFLKDNGMGIKKENLVKVFGLFERFNPEVPGTGIGLSTVKRIIEAHGGKIWAESEGEGMGTTMCFTVPEVSTGVHP